MRLFYSTITLCLLIPNLKASVSQGKEIYAKACVKCHPYPTDMASKKNSKEWKRIFKYQVSTDELAKIHLRLEESKLSWIYFKDKNYEKESKHLRDFMLKYSSDRGQHNSCF